MFLLLHRILIIFSLTIVLSSAARIPKFFKNGMSFYDGQLTEAKLPWLSDFANPMSVAYKQQKTTYEAQIKTALVTQNKTRYGDVGVSVSEFSGTWITETVSGTIVTFVLGLSSSVQLSDVEIDNDLELGSKLVKYQWFDVDVHNAGLPPLPKPRLTAGWKEAANMFLQSINTSVDPCQNFFNYACDNYIAKHPIGDQPTQSTFDVLQDTVFYNLTKSFELLNNSTTEHSKTLKTANTIYQACKAVTNTTYQGPELVLEIANTYGGWPLLDPMWNYSRIPNDIYWVIGDMFTKYGVPTLFVPLVEIDGRDISKHILYLDQASLTIPAAYYQNSNLSQRYQDQLRNTIYQTVKTINKDMDNETLLPQIDQMVAIEYHLAMISVNGSEERNMSLGYNPYSAATAQKEFPAFNWTSYLTGLVHSIYPQDNPVTLLNPFIIEEPHKYGRDLNKYLALANENSETMRDLVNYLIFRLITPYMQFAGEDLARLFKELRKGYELEQLVITDQEKQCAEYITNNIPYAAGRLYVDGYFPQINRDDVEVMINNVLSAFSSTLSGLHWMDNVSALRAYQKVAGLVRNVAYADWQQNDTQLDAYHQSLIDAINHIDVKDPFVYYEYNLQVVQFGQRVMFNKLKQATDRKEFGMSSAIVNAWYQPIRNSITFPAAILNQPFYRYDFPQAVNYGGLGVVMGHELSHGFDDQGVQFDWNGTLHTWMTPQAESGFNKMAQCVVDEYSDFCYPGLACINGITTQGENIGDNGGLKAAYRAYQAYTAAHGDEPPLPGMETFTMDQIFFLSYGQVWCGSYSEDALLRQLLTNPHSPGKDRVIGAVQNFPKFAEAFQCKKGDPMYPLSACDVW